MRTDNSEHINRTKNLNILRLEVNILTFPLFVLDKELVGRPGHIQCRIQRKGEELIWVVSGHKSPSDVSPKLKKCFGLPGPFDKDILYAVIWDIEKNHQKPFHDPYVIRSWRHILDLAHKSYSSENIELAKTAVKRLSVITVYQSNAFFVKEAGKYRSEESIFRPFTRVILKGERDGRDELIEENVLYFDPLLLSNINNRYVKPIDYELYMNLQRPLARRIFEILDPKFYALRKRKEKRVNFRYSTLCQLLPSRQQVHYSCARRIFDRAFDELYKSDYLADAEWTKTDDRHDWLIHYVPGKIPDGNGAVQLSLAEAEKVDYRKSLTRRLQRYIPNASIPREIPDRTIDHFLYKIEEGEIMPEKIKSPVAYMKGLTDEPFPSLIEREEMAKRKEREMKGSREHHYQGHETHDDDYRREMQQLIREFNASFIKGVPSHERGGESHE